MKLDSPSETAPYDALFLSPHAHDAPLACAARLLAERERGARVLLVTVCGEPGAGIADGWAAALERRGVDLLRLGYPEAVQRDPAYATLRAVAFGHRAGDHAAAMELAAGFEKLDRRVHARNIYAPLAVGGHADHRLVLEAVLRVFTPGEGRNVFLYEERPAVLLRGALRLRLGQLGASLPPEARLPDDASLPGLLLRFLRGAWLACGPTSWSERLRCAVLVARQWRETRAWRPQRGLGLRLQPLLFPTDAARLESLGALQREWPAVPGPGTPERLERLAADYARRLGSGAHAERYWLLLPPRSADGRYSPPAHETGDDLS